MIIVIIISLATIAGLVFPGYFPMHDDLQAMRIWELEKCFADGQIPCRWVPDMAFGFGQAIFNYYSALPYYLGVLIRLLFGFPILDTVKVLFAMSLVGGTLGMYYLSREFFGRSGGIIAGVLYALAPYRALNVYVRGALAESFSLAILPFLWLFIYRAIKNPSYKNSVLVALATAALLVTHNISTMMYAGFTVLWALFWLAQNFKGKSVLSLFVGGFMGLMLAGFFMLPVIFERTLIREEFFVSGYSNYAGHFTTLNQLFLSRFWGFGGSAFGENDWMSFQIGWPHWWVGVLAGFLAIFGIFRKKSITKSIMVLGLLAMALFGLFMTHNKSTFIWEAIGPVSFVQFPWRFVGLSVFLLSLAAGGISVFIRGFARMCAVVGIVFLALVLNLNYFKPERTYGWLTDEVKLSGVDLEMQKRAAALDYLPVTVEEPPIEFAQSRPEIAEGNGEIPNFTKTSSTFFFDAYINEPALVDVPIFYFPDWEVYILKGQGERVNAYPSEEKGLIRIELPEGKHMVYGKFVNTPVRALGNILTVVGSFVLLGGAALTGNKRKFLGLK